MRWKIGLYPQPKSTFPPALATVSLVPLLGSRQCSEGGWRVNEAQCQHVTAGPQHWGSGVCTEEWVILKECRYQNAGSSPATYELDYLFLADTNFHTLGGKSAGFMHHFALDCVQLLYLSLCNWTQGNSTPNTKLEIYKYICTVSLLSITIFVSLHSPRWTAQNKTQHRKKSP